MSELEELIQRIEKEKASGVNHVVMDAVLYLLRRQRVAVSHPEGVTVAGPAITQGMSENGVG